jgi:ferredoxin
MFSELELREMTRIRAPFVNAEACVGCGICQYRCHTCISSRSGCTGARRRVRGRTWKIPAKEEPQNQVLAGVKARTLT